MLTRWDPFAEIARIQDQFARWTGRESPGGTTFSPAVDIFEDKDAITVKAELGGMKPDDVRLNVEDNVLTLSGERRLEHADEREGYHRLERAFGSFTRSFALPANADSEHVDATMNEGILTVRIPKKTTREPKRIEVKTNETGAGTKGGQPVRPS